MSVKEFNTILVYFVTCGLKAETCPSAGLDLAEHVPVVTRNAPTKKKKNKTTTFKHLVASPRWVLYAKTDWPTDRRS
jgi:hypothetical protein